MKVDFDKSFSKRVDKVKNQRVKQQTIKFIKQLEVASNLDGISNIKKLKGDTISFRKQIGDYRIGFEFENNIIRLITIAHRKDIYKFFP